MFSSILRSQARSSLLTVARSAVPASRTLSSFILRQAVAAPVVSRLAVARAFSSGSVLAYEREEREEATPSDTLFVGNMPWDMTEEDLKQLFSEYGTVTAVRIQVGSDGRPRGFSHVTFASPGEAGTALSSHAEEPLHVGGRDLRLNYAIRRSAPVQEPNQRLFFSKFTEDEDALRAMMGEYQDQIVSVYFIRDGDTGERLNSGFVEFATQEVATQALTEFNGAATPDGSNLILNYARPKRDRQAGGGDRRPSRGNDRSYGSRGGSGGGGGYQGRSSGGYQGRSSGGYQGRSEGGSRGYQSRGDRDF